MMSTLGSLATAKNFTSNDPDSHHPSSKVPAVLIASPSLRAARPAEMTVRVEVNCAPDSDRPSWTPAGMLLQPCSPSSLEATTVGTWDQSWKAADQGRLLASALRAPLDSVRDRSWIFISNTEGLDAKSLGEQFSNP